MVEFVCEIPEQRVIQPEQVLLVRSDGWDERTLTETYNVYREPATGIAMLRPIPLTSEFQSSAAGVYARLRLSDTNRSAHSAWSEFERGFAGNFFLHASTLADGHADRVVSTTASYPKNTPFYVSIWLYNYGGDRREFAEFGYVAPGSGVSFRLWTDSQIEIWRGTNYLDTVRIERESSARAGTAQTVQNQQFELLVVPCRRRSIVFITNWGGNAVYEFDDLDPELPDNEITPAGAFWVKIPAGTCTFQFAHVRFRERGYLYSTLREFLYPPATGTSVSASVYQDAPGVGTNDAVATLRTADGTALFVPDGTTTQARVRVELTGDGFSTRWVYGASGHAARKTASIPDSRFAVGDRFSWRVGAEPDDRQLTVSGRRPDTISSAWRTIQNRSCEFKIDSKLVFVGRTLPAGLSDVRAFEDVEHWSLECQDRWRALELQIVRDYRPLDGLELSAAIRELAIAAGLSNSDLDLDATGFNLPTVAGAGQSEWSVLPALGESYAAAIARLWRDYARTWTLGFAPGADGYKLRFKPPASPPYTAAIKIYLSRAEALADGVSESELYRRTIYQYSERTRPAECNEIVLNGWDPVRRRPFRRVYRDTASQDPTLAPGARPENWLGECVAVGMNDYTITTISAADRALDILKQRLTVPQRRAQVQSQLLLKTDGFPVWCNEIVEIHAHGYWRVVSFTVEFVVESATPFRRAIYELEKV